MEIGAFILAQQRGYHQPSGQVVRNTIAQTVACEAAGFAEAWYAEHHFNNYSLVPSPLMMVAHCAALTSRIRLGTAVCVLPLYQPQRLLSEIGFADVVSNGRLDLGVGSGYQMFEFERFGIDVTTAPEVFSDYLDVIQKGLTQKIFEHDGPHLKVPPTAISIRSEQQPHAPIWLAAGSARSMGRAYRDGNNLFVTAFQDGLDTIRRLRGQIEEAAATAGKAVGDARIAFLRCAYASDNEAEIESYLDNARWQRRLSAALQHRRAQSDDGYMVREMPNPGEQTLEDMRASLPVGSVNRVIERMIEEIEILRPNQVAIQTQLGDFDQTTMLKQIDLWGEKIIPAISKAVGKPVRMSAAS